MPISKGASESINKCYKINCSWLVPVTNPPRHGYVDLVSCKFKVEFTLSSSSSNEASILHHLIHDPSSLYYS